MILNDTATPVTASVYRKQMLDTRKNILENIAKKDPARAAELKAGLSRMDETISNLERSRRNVDDDRKEAARQKIDQLKKELQLLRLRTAGDPKTATRMAARLSRELASAIRDYAGAGGVSNMSAVTAGNVDGMDKTSAKQNTLSVTPQDETLEEAKQLSKKLQDLLKELKRKHKPGAAASADIDAARASLAQADMAMNKKPISILV